MSELFAIDLCLVRRFGSVTFNRLRTPPLAPLIASVAVVVGKIQIVYVILSQPQSQFALMIKPANEINRVSKAISFRSSPLGIPYIIGPSLVGSLGETKSA